MWPGPFFDPRAAEQYPCTCMHNSILACFYAVFKQQLSRSPYLLKLCVYHDHGADHPTWHPKVADTTSNGISSSGLQEAEADQAQYLLLA